MVKHFSIRASIVVLLICSCGRALPSDPTRQDSQEEKSDSVKSECTQLVMILCRESFYGSKKSPEAMERLAEIGQPAVTELVKLLDERAWLPRFRAVQVLGMMGPEAKNALPGLEKELSEDGQHFLLKTYIPLSTAAILEQPQPLIDFIADKENHKHPPHRRFAAQLLGNMGGKAEAAIPVLTAYAKQDRKQPSPIWAILEAIDPEIDHGDYPESGGTDK